jgi:hypothetical protein
MPGRQLADLAHLVEFCTRYFRKFCQLRHGFKQTGTLTVCDGFQGHSSRFSMYRQRLGTGAITCVTGIPAESLDKNRTDHPFDLGTAYLSYTLSIKRLSKLILG